MSRKKQPVYQVLVKTETHPMPHWAGGVESGADVALWQSYACICLLTRTVPPRYTGGWRTRKRNEYVRELTALATKLRSLTWRRRQTLLKKIENERVVQENVLAALRPQKRRPTFGADFGNLHAGERVGSFSPVGGADSYW